MKQSSSDLHLTKPRSVAERARKLLEVHESKRWREAGFKNFRTWSNVHLSYKKSETYALVRIGRLLTLPSLADEHIDQLGFSVCDQLARLYAKRELDAEWVERAAKEGPKEFKMAVERHLGRSHKNPVLGEPLEPSFRGLTHAPTSEQGVVYLFGMVSPELGFRVEAVRNRYPDCIAKERVSAKPERWRTVRIEFEHLSSKFDHPPEGSDLIVCWEDDLKRCGKTAPLRVLELRSEIEKLSRTLPTP